MNDERDDDKQDKTPRLTIEEIERLSDDEFAALPRDVRADYSDWMTRDNLPPLWECYGYESEQDYLNERRNTCPEDDFEDDGEGCTEGGEPSDAPPMPRPARDDRHEDPKRNRQIWESMWDMDGPMVCSCPWAQAIEDGDLVPVCTKLAKEAGFQTLVGVTPGVWDRYVAVPEGVGGQDKAGRLGDILRMCRSEIGRGRGDASEIPFALHVRNDHREGEPPLVTLKAVYVPGDDGKPCITIMLPEED